jgi:arylsulfatase A-like enzyme
LVCQAAEKTLGDLKKDGKPFFLAVGFRKPHLPFSAPKKYWDLYDRESIPPPASNKHPEGAPEPAVRSWGELEGYSDIPKNGKLSVTKTQELRHGYYACVSYVDALTGRLLKKLDEIELTGRTVVLLWGDHGFHLGEQGLWTKANNYELSTRVPLILSVPGQANLGAQTDALVEFVDLYPTLAEICGLKAPAKVEGISLLPLLQKPDRPWKTAAFSQYPRSFKGNRHRKHGDLMGYTVRTDRYRYVEWRNWKTGAVQARELYDHQTDPNEIKNLAKEPTEKENLKQLQQTLQSGWKAALPQK